MTVPTGPRPLNRSDTAWIMLRIHLHALRHTPQPYLLAAWWRFRRKRVRAKAHFAPLLASSRLAYRLWLRSEEPASVTNAAGPAIMALVDCDGIDCDDATARQAHIEITLRSVTSEGITALIIGSSEVPTLADAVSLIPWSEEPWLMPIVAGDVLARGAVSAYRNAAGTTKACIVYADDDLLNKKGHRHTPHFKPGWNAELFCHFDYLAGACILRSDADALKKSSGKRWSGRLVKLIASTTIDDPPVHLPRVLHHRISRPAPRVPAALDSIGALPPISVIVPTRNRVDLLRTCLDGLGRTDYPDLEVIVVDNGSDDPATLAYLDGLDPSRHRVLRQSGPFNFSALNNRAADQANGTLLCLLNNDIEVLTPDWLAIMARQSLRKDVGAVGARLLYPDGRIQHAGVVLGIGGGAAHAHRLLDPDEEGYFRRHALPQFVSAVTAACLVVQRKRFESVGGLDEANFAVAFNDVDFCMRLNARGWQSLYEPRATLMHHESVSRGLDRDPVGSARLTGELAALKTVWNTEECIDPFHHPQLNRFSERFAVRF